MEHDTTSKSGRVINVGTRQSQLAMIQTNLVIDYLKCFYDNNPRDIKFNVIPMTTTGDQILDKALPDIGSKSLFTKELEVALLERKVDFVVHSLKDLPTTLPEGCAIGAIAKRDDPEDSIVLKQSLRTKIKPLDLIFNKSGQKHCIGTSSQRRIAMLRCCNQELECDNIRGNLNTRLAKLDEDDGKYSAIILARAGLNRMGWTGRASETLTPRNDSRLSHWCYAVGQGALAIECRGDDEYVLDLLSPLMDVTTAYEAVAERALMRKLEGGCSVPLGVRTTWLDQEANILVLNGIVLSLDGKQMVEAMDKVTLNELSSLSLPRPKSELITLTTGIILSNSMHDRLAVNMEKCAQLGVSVANKMIELGCLELMRRSKE